MVKNNHDHQQIVSRLLRDLEQVARRDHLPSIGPVKGKIISDVIKKYRPTSILEIGTLHGYSAILMGSLLPPGGRLITIEIDKNLANIARKNIDKAGGRLSDKIQVIYHNAIDAIPTLSGHKFDMVFLDAVKDEYLQYLRLIEQKNLIKEHSIVVADNVILYENEMKDYLEYVRNSGNYKSQTTGTTLEFTKKVKDALEISIKSNK
jgi:catechol O-methyltransferase